MEQLRTQLNDSPSFLTRTDECSLRQGAPSLNDSLNNGVVIELADVLPGLKKDTEGEKL